MLSRRRLLGACAAGGLGLLTPALARAEAVLTDDGFYREPWFLESFLELSDDLAAATEKKKRFAIMWELRGCPFCKDTHLVNFAKPEIESFIKERFDILQLNIIGSREVTDFDGEKLSERTSRGSTACAACRPSSSFPTAPRDLRARPRANARSLAHAATSSRSRSSICFAMSRRETTKRAACCSFRRAKA